MSGKGKSYTIYHLYLPTWSRHALPFPFHRPASHQPVGATASPCHPAGAGASSAAATICTNVSVSISPSASFTVADFTTTDFAPAASVLSMLLPQSQQLTTIYSPYLPPLFFCFCFFWVFFGPQKTGGVDMNEKEGGEINLPMFKLQCQILWVLPIDQRPRIRPRRAI